MKDPNHLRADPDRQGMRGVVDLIRELYTFAAGDTTIQFQLPFRINGAAPASPVAGTVYSGAGKWVEIDRQTASGAATVDFTTMHDSRFSAIRYRLIGVTPQTDDTELYMRVSVSGTFQAGASDYYWSFRAQNQAGAADSGDAADSEIEMITAAATGGLGNASTESLSGVIELTNHASTALYKLIDFRNTYVDAAGRPTTTRGGGAFLSASAVDGARFLMSSGNISGLFIAEGFLSV